MLTILEELVLLAVNPNTGELVSTHEFGMGYALVGAVFFDLALSRQIDTDTEEIRILATAPSGHPVWDAVLAEMRNQPGLRTVRDWIEAMFRGNHDLEGAALASLIAGGILRRQKSKRLWLIEVERFPLVDRPAQTRLRERLAGAILGDQIPDPRDIMLVSLAEPCGLLRCLLSEAELESRKQRIAMLSNLETISRKVSLAIADLDASVRQTPHRLG
ncbi:MAG TPA: GPP34 family phosphoprotein [Bryobacteraceae bacterium]|nr:GPP34 family phosphoprotein [Bryobacteraceae bacterium]